MSRLFEYKVCFYTLRPLPLELRKTFSLKTNPYRDASSLEEFAEYGLFFFRDDFHAHGIVVNADGRDLTKENTFQAYRYIVKLETDNKTFSRVGTWASGMTQKTFKDKLAWLEWGRQMTVLRLSKESVQWLKN